MRRELAHIIHAGLVTKAGVAVITGIPERAHTAVARAAGRKGGTAYTHLIACAVVRADGPASQSQVIRAWLLGNTDIAHTESKSVPRETSAVARVAVIAIIPHDARLAGAGLRIP